MSVLTAPAPSALSTQPRSALPVAPLSVAVGDYDTLLRAGAVAVDVRSQDQRDRDGIILGALAIPAHQVLDRLIPGTPHALRTAGPARRWILIGVDGHDAEMLTWHLQAAGVHGARFVAGGQAALARSGERKSVAEHTEREWSTISAH
jgi:rhodanese-related sulfurtransferase